jgi:hypothetical protein
MPRIAGTASLTHDPVRQALTSGYNLAMAACIAFSLAAAFIAAVVIRNPGQQGSREDRSHAQKLQPGGKVGGGTGRAVEHCRSYCVSQSYTNIVRWLFRWLPAGGLRSRSSARRWYWVAALRAHRRAHPRV